MIAVWYLSTALLKKEPSFRFSSRFKKNFRDMKASPHGGEEKHSHSSGEWDTMPIG